MHTASLILQRLQLKSALVALPLHQHPEYASANKHDIIVPRAAETRYGAE